MDKKHPPETFGVFKPVGHTVMAFRSAIDQQAAVNALLDQKFSDLALVRYSPEEMKAQVDAELQNASALAGFGYELDLIKMHRALAEDGCSFLIVCMRPKTRKPSWWRAWREPQKQSRHNTMAGS